MRLPVSPLVLFRRFPARLITRSFGARMTQPPEIFEGVALSGECGPLIKAFDWASTPIGPIASWPRSLKGYVSMILALPTPAIIFWGPRQTQIYNDGYIAIIGPRHPRHYGATFKDCWPDTYPTIYPWMQKVLQNGEVIQVEREYFPLTRHGVVEEAYFTFTFSPLRDDTGQIAGIFQPVVELTQIVVRDRREAAVLALSLSADGSIDALSSNPHDVPWAIFFSGTDATLRSRIGPPVEGAALARATLLARQVTATGKPAEHLADDPPICVFPVSRVPAERHRGAIAFGINPLLPFDPAYRAFFENIARTVAANLEAVDAATHQQALRNQLYGVIENAPAFIALLGGPRHVFQMANPLYTKLVGVGRKLIGLPAAEALPEVVGQGFIDLLDTVYSTGQPHFGNEVELFLDRKGNGQPEPAFVNFVYQPRRALNGAVEGVDVFGFEVTPQVQARRAIEALAEQLRVNEGNFRTLSESIPQQVWTAEPSGAIDFVNARVAIYFGTTREQILGAGWQGVIHPDDLPEAIRRWTHALATGDEYEIEFRLLGDDGHYRWHLGRARPLRDEKGTVVRWFGTNTDIDEAKLIREDLKRRSEFEQHLVGIVSHDLRNPLNAILLSAGAMQRREDLDPKATRAIDRILSSADRASRMIRDLLDFTRVRLGGAIPLAVATVDVPELVRAGVDELEAANPTRKISVTHGGEPEAFCDPDRLTQVLQNLTQNAINYSSEGTPVTVSTFGDAQQITLSVHNDGNPIPPDKLGRIFEPLQRATLDVDRTGRSIGLGLYIVRSIVKAHGGGVDVRSNAGEGTTFTIRLPRALPL